MHVDEINRRRVIMADFLVCQKDTYYDSVTLMTLSNKLKKMDGVVDAVVSMGTPMNRGLLERIGLLRDGLEEAGPNDLMIAIRAGSEEQCRGAYEQMDALLHEKKGGAAKETVYHTIAEAKKAEPELNLAVISVKGEFAAREAREALKRDMHVMLFSDNVTVEQELACALPIRSTGDGSAWWLPPEPVCRRSAYW